MRTFTIFVCFFFSIFLSNSFASPRIGFDQLMIQAEIDPQSVLHARSEAQKLNFPVYVLSNDGIIIQVKAVENGRPVYAVITDFANPYNGGYTAFYEDVKSRINFANSLAEYADGKVVDNTGGKYSPVVSDNSAINKVVMIAESTNDRVYLFRADNGAFIDTAFIPSTRPQLSTPKVALQHHDGKSILICDQITDLVQKFNFNGTYSGIFAPIGGPITSIVDNMRGMAYRPNNNILVSVGSSANQNTIQQFDQTGAHLGTFASGNMNSPFDVLVRQNDVLVSNFSGTNRVSRFDLSGVYIASFYTGSNFGISQQLCRFPNGYVAVAAFQTPTGVAILDSTGAFLKLLTGATGNRGAFLLENGNVMTTNATGAYILDSATGALLSTAALAPNFQYITSYQLNNATLRLTINYELCSIIDTVDVELRNSTSPYSLVESQQGIGGTAVPQMIEFTTATNATPYYVVVKQRGSIAVWSAAALSFTSNYLIYNFTYTAAQAYGSNQINVGGKFSLYTGDPNQDEIVDVVDLVTIYNNQLNSGYLPEDLNCDDFVDVTDLLAAYNNSTLGIEVMTPP